MTRKDFELIAATIASAPVDPYIREEVQLQRVIALEFARVLAHTNPHFDRARFLRACGVTP